MGVGTKHPVVMGAEKAKPNGVATLDANGKLVQMPSAADVGAVNRNGDTVPGYIFKLNDGVGYIGSYGTTDAGDNTALGIYKTAHNDNNKRTINLWGQSDIKSMLTLRDYTDGARTDYTVLHTGNKPSGSYTGNGDATARTIDTGGIGNAVLIWTDDANAVATLLSPVGGIAKNKDGVTSIGWSHGCVYKNDIVISTTDARLNASGVTYYYQVL